MRKTILILRIIWVYFQIYVVSPFGILFRIPGFVLYALSLILFKNRDDQRSQSGKMTRAMDAIVEDREPNADQSRFMEEYADKTLKLAYQFWIGAALIALLIKYL